MFQHERRGTASPLFFSLTSQPKKGGGATRNKGSVIPDRVEGSQHFTSPDQRLFRNEEFLGLVQVLLAESSKAWHPSSELTHLLTVGFSICDGQV